MPDLIDRTSLSTWFTDRPPEYACLVAARAALRLVPLLGEALHPDSGDRESTIVLPSLRALASASFAASSPDRAEKVVHGVDAVCQNLVDTIDELAYGSALSIIEYRDMDDLVGPKFIHELEQHKAGLYVVRDIINATSHAIQTILYRVNHDKRVASKKAVITAAVSTIGECESVLLRHISRYHDADNSENIDAHSTPADSTESGCNQLMTGIPQDIEFLDSEGLDDPNPSDIVAIVSE